MAWSDIVAYVSTDKITTALMNLLRTNQKHLREKPSDLRLSGTAWATVMNTSPYEVDSGTLEATGNKYLVVLTLMVNRPSGAYTRGIQVKIDGTIYKPNNTNYSVSFTATNQFYSISWVVDGVTAGSKTVALEVLNANANPVDVLWDLNLIEIGA